MQVALGILVRSASREQQGIVQDLKDEVEGMSALVNEVLAFSKASLRPSEARLEPVGLEELVSRVVQRDGGGASINVEVETGLRALANPELLARGVSNVLRNAVRYSGSAGPIEIAARAAGEGVVIQVADCGPGMAEQDLEAVFQPFYRLEAARERETGGVGLGLAIVKTCIESCQGTVRCRNRAPHGLEVEMRLKRA
jgi:two-component system sensor histidine kinase CpxA